MRFNAKKFVIAICVATAFAFFALAGLAIAKESPAFSKGRQFYKNQDYQKALEEFQRAVRDNSGASLQHYYLGLTYAKLQQFNRAVNSLKKAISLNPKLTAAYLSLGVNQYKLKSYDAALKSLRRAVRADPKNGSAYFFAGLAYQGKKEYQKSIRAFHKARGLSADLSHAALFNIGLANFKMKKDRQADKYFRRTIDADPRADISKSARKFRRIIAYRSKKEKRWSLEASAGFEYNDNVISAEEDLVSGGDDIAAVLEFAGSFKFLDSTNFEAEVSYNFSSAFIKKTSPRSISSRTAPQYPYPENLIKS